MTISYHYKNRPVRFKGAILPILPGGYYAGKKQVDTKVLNYMNNPKLPYRSYQSYQGCGMAAETAQRAGMFIRPVMAKALRWAGEGICRHIGRNINRIDNTQLLER